ncbi:branched-chain-amino-acid transaminase [bacterium CG10_46_32]|nr:MAG: branched-chain-amino-acid transaminase [bacterium CG10_46_32]PIR55712.1 MAG: branched chain amino acid aminotransferase [Parcubacteria group bacterium CG10_big_fil_rev_8_21_14_0_10_46_32]
MPVDRQNDAHTTLPTAAPCVWMDGEYLPIGDANIPITTHSLHYGTAVFEGIRFYETERGPAVFRLDDHFRRFFASADVLGMVLPYDMEGLKQVTCELITRNGLAAGYIRAIAFFGEGISLIRDDLKVRVAIFLLPWPVHKGKDPVRLEVSRFTKPSPVSIVHEAKVAGHYVNSYMAATSAKQPGYGGALLLDGQGNVAETPVANIFGVKSGGIYTPQTGSILPGITRATVLELASELGIPAHARTVSLDELMWADELFITGTAAEVTPVAGIGQEVVGSGAVGRITAMLMQMFEECVHGRDTKFQHWLTYT